MTTSTTSDLSAEAKEFVPLIQIPPSITMPSVYSYEQPQPLIYPLMKIPEIDFHIQPTQQFHIDSCSIDPSHSSASQIILIPNNRCYPNGQLLFPSTDPSSSFYPMKYAEQSAANYSHRQVKSNRVSSVRQQRGSHHSRNSRTDHNQPTDEQRRFNFRSEDFPSLPMTNSSHAKPSIQSNIEPTPSWNTVVSTPRPQSTSPHPVASSSKKKSSPPSTEPSRSQSLTKKEGESVRAKKKRSKQQKSKVEEQEAEQQMIPQSAAPSFTLHDETAFPSLGQEIPKSAINKPDSTTTPGLISTSKIKTNQTYQIRLTDMFNALSTSTQTKQRNTTSVSLSKTQKSSTVPVTGANPLDSNPAPKRGKEREQPKPRKPTKLKRIINKELEENKKQRQHQQLITKASTAIQASDVDGAMNDLSHNEYTSASCTEESNNESDDDDDDDDEIIDHEPTSQLQTPFSHQTPPSNVKQQIHDAGFREYCSQLIDRQLDELCIQLLITLKRFQDRKKQQFQSNPERARRKRRFVHGIREVTKHLRLQRLKCVFIAPDCQSIQSEGGLNDVIEHIINLCKEQNIPFIFTLNRQKLGRCLNKSSRISAIGIFDCSGVDDIYKQIVDITNENQRAYKQIIDNILKHDETATATPSHGLNLREFYKILHRTFQQQQQRTQIVNNIPNESLSKLLPKVPAHYAHSRQTSDTSTIYIDPQLINSIKKQHARASSGTFDMGKAATKKSHQRTLSDGAAAIEDTSIPIKHHGKTHSRTPSGCSAISQMEQQDSFEQLKNILMDNDDVSADNEENRLKSIHEDTEENSANTKRKHVAKWINEN